jgi:hypothetical protein
MSPGSAQFDDVPEESIVKNLPYIAAAAFLGVLTVSLPLGVYYKTRNDGRHVEQMARQADAQERIADALERAHPAPIKSEKPVAAKLEPSMMGARVAAFQPGSKAEKLFIARQGCGIAVLSVDATRAEVQTCGR